MSGRALAFAAAALVVASFSGAVDAVPRTPEAPRGMASPYLGTAIAGGGRALVAVDPYGQVVDLRSAPGGPAMIRNPHERQRVGSVDPATGWQLRAGAGREPAPLWLGTELEQRYLPGTNVVVTRGRVAGARVSIIDAAHPSGPVVGRRVRVEGRSPRALVESDPSLCAQRRTSGPGLLVVDLVCRLGGSTEREPRFEAVLRAASAADRAWVARSRPLRESAPSWARRLYLRSLLALRALTDSRTGAQLAGARDFWAHVWPRDAAAGAIALAAAGHRGDAKRIAGFLQRLDLSEAARFDGDGTPVADGRPAAGDAAGWVAAAAGSGPPRADWEGRQDYAENIEGDLLGNALAAGVSEAEAIERFADEEGRLVRRAGDPGSELDSAAAWAVAPFRAPGLSGHARRTLLDLARQAGRHGIEPTAAWPGPDPWTAPTAWSAWALIRLGETPAADRLLAALDRSATGAGLLPERVDAETGVPLSTTPLAWSHAFAVLALRARYPG